MKCDELKDYDYDPDFPFQSRGRFYVADEVDAAIDELKSTHHKERHEYINMIAELKQKLEDAKATAYAESVDAGMENRRLKREVPQEGGGVQMSELKEWTASEIEEYDDARLELAEDGKIECTRVYIKADADQVIAEKDKAIAELKADYKEACGRLQTANLIKDEQFAAARHHKYKRCLDKANYWLAVSYNCIDDEHRQKAEKHHYRWLELAAKFKDKEAK